MKHFWILLTLLPMTLLGQDEWLIDFEDPILLDRVLIDTISDQNNIWQVGHPNKPVFADANSEFNAIVTDTANSYPVNDTSSFTIIHIAQEAWFWGDYPNITIGGYYNVNSDTLTDYGFIDYSMDLGNTWYVVDNSDVYCGWSEPVLPVFTGNSNGWKYFNYCLEVPMSANLGDTIYYRFTFISDSIQTYKDGLMFDDLHFVDWVEGIEEFEFINSKISPNPTNDLARIEFENPTAAPFLLTITDALGRRVHTEQTNQQNITLQTDQLANGIYYYSLISTESREQANGKFVVQRE